MVPTLARGWPAAWPSGGRGCPTSAPTFSYHVVSWLRPDAGTWPSRPGSQYLVLLMVTPVLLIFGHPITLLGRVCRVLGG
jgi:hypothetical protein